MKGHDEEQLYPFGVFMNLDRKVLGAATATCYRRERWIVYQTPFRSGT